MECFSGIGGMMRVGCRLTRAARRELNSEYRLRTSISCDLQFSRALGFAAWTAYPGAYCISNVILPPLMGHASICDYNLQVWVLVEYLLDSAVIATGLPGYVSALRRILLVVLFITEIAGP